MVRCHTGWLLVGARAGGINHSQCRPNSLRALVISSIGVVIALLVVLGSYEEVVRRRSLRSSNVSDFTGLPSLIVHTLGRDFLRCCMGIITILVHIMLPYYEKTQTIVLNNYCYSTTIIFFKNTVVRISLFPRHHWFFCQLKSCMGSWTAPMILYHNNRSNLLRTTPFHGD